MASDYENVTEDEMVSVFADYDLMVMEAQGAY